ncbi:drug/metabolite transporter (DMT)-like permease [Cryobacterium mesophilum]|uniref:DMT family transporter n=1 Tax=Terrimesophilobacter mesophilus TaxID=433647 RepID=A0A4R8VAM1_9MICO|nr:EamA family transporter [Terrimesophilobacter mesophilus]MBB5632295.1 drug/metabolite transporter (DMT)-like permease [Terrimesophilobacter mesophilus]TFB79140.1 DMT family transporter [Terrimesophilobacter mesophilus]
MTAVVILALLASLLYGASDFLGALTARRLTVITASTAIYLTAAVVAALALVLFPWVYSDEALWAGSIAGLFAIVGMVTFYAALAIGPMSLLAPLIALIQTAVPVIVAAVTGQSLHLVAWIAVVLALVATTLISIPAGVQTPGSRIERITPRGGMLALVSGVTLGLSVVSLDTAPIESGVFPAFLDIAVGFVVLLPLLAVRRLRTGDGWLKGEADAAPQAELSDAGPAGARIWITSAVAGALLGIGNILLVIALHSGNLAVVAVLMGLYPVGTVILARLVLKERMSLVQFFGVALAITAAILLGTS